MFSCVETEGLWSLGLHRYLHVVYGSVENVALLLRNMFCQNVYHHFLLLFVHNLQMFIQASSPQTSGHIPLNVSWYSLGKSFRRCTGEWKYNSTILGLGTRCRWVVSFVPWLFYPCGKRPHSVPTEYEAGWVPELVRVMWSREKSVAPAGNWTSTIQPAAILAPPQSSKPFNCPV